MKKVALALLVVASVFMASLAWGSTPFNQSKPATRDQVFRNIVSAAQGNFFVQRGASRTPFFPKGFPQWGDQGRTVEQILGRPREKRTVNGIEFFIYDEGVRSFGVGFSSGKMTVLCFDSMMDNMTYYANLVGWQKVNPVEKSPFDHGDKDELDLRKVSFYGAGRSRKYTAYAWFMEGFDESNILTSHLRAVGLPEAAQAFGVM